MLIDIINKTGVPCMERDATNASWT